MKLDILAFGAHPDDVELSCSATLMKAAANGKKTGIIDLTQGEMGTRGSVAIRYEEAAAAAKIMAVSVRENLKMRDGFFKNDEAHQIQLIEMIRKYQPDIVLANALYDRHPDHGRAAELVRDATFLAGLSKIETTHQGVAQAAWRPKVLYHYIQSINLEPDFLVDISDYFERKIQSILAYKSQFYNPDSKEPETFISSPEFLSAIGARMQAWGQNIGVKYAEGFQTNRYIGTDCLSHLI